ncbi:MAG: hypothetical protein ABEJ72_02735, partial [Candidatus Aenigmatarchaeota archaeon]
MSGFLKAEEALEKRKDIGFLEVAREHAISESVSGLGIRPDEDIIDHEVDGYSFNALIDSYSATELGKLKNEKKQEFGELIEHIDLEKTMLDKNDKENLRIAIKEYKRNADLPSSVTRIVEGENGLRQKWGEAEKFSEVEDEFIAMIKAFRNYSNQDYGNLIAIWEPHIPKEDIENTLEKIREEAINILEELDLEEIESLWAEVEDSIDTSVSLEEIRSNPTWMHETLANYILGGNPIKMPVRIGGSGMEYGNAVMAPLQTIDDRFWLKCFDTTAHEFGHTYGRKNLSSRNSFLP